MDLIAPQPGGDFGSAADSPARLSLDDVAAFKTHLRKCWRPSAEISAGEKVRAVVRVFLSREGALSGEPVLLEASASRSGPQLVATAMRALHACQPYSFLPADKYEEWRLLDITFSPQEMGG